MATATALKKPEIKTELPGPKGRAIVEADAQFVNPAYPRPDFKLVAERGEGVWVTDVDGNVFLDCNAGVAVCSTGHCRARNSGSGRATDSHVRHRLLLLADAGPGEEAR